MQLQCLACGEVQALYVVLADHGSDSGQPFLGNASGAGAQAHHVAASVALGKAAKVAAVAFVINFAECTLVVGASFSNKFRKLRAQGSLINHGNAHGKPPFMLVFLMILYTNIF